MSINSSPRMFEPCERLVSLVIDSSPRMFEHGERFTVKHQLEAPLDKPPFALKPVALYLSEGGGEAAWQIHDVCVNGRSQLEGDELAGFLFSPHRPSNAQRAIVSGFDTIAIGEMIELDVSFRGASGNKQTSFHAALCALEVDPARDVTEYSGMIRFRGVNGTLVASACEGPPRVLPDEAAWFVARPKDLAFQPEHLVIGHRSQDWLIEDIRAGDRSQFVQSQPILGDVFGPEAPDTFVKFDAVSSARPFAIMGRYVGSNPLGGRFDLVVHGKVASLR